MISLKEIEILEGKTGFLKSRLEKVYRLLELLKEISRHSFLSNTLALKGGTAINLFFFDCPRLSVDLDFNFIGTVNKEEAEIKRKEIATALASIFRFFRYEVDSKSSEGIEQYFASYDTLAKSKDKLKIEVNYLLRLPLQKPVLSLTRTPYRMDFKTQTLSLEEIYAGKCVALFDRMTPRDLFDVYMLNSPEAPPIDFPTLKKFFLVYSSISRSSFFDFSIKSLQDLTDKEIKDELWLLLSKQNRVTKSEMIKRANPFLEKLLHLNAPEKEFFETFYQGKPDFSLIFDDSNLSQICKEHPMVLWKQSHLKTYKPS